MELPAILKWLVVVPRYWESSEAREEEELEWLSLAALLEEEDHFLFRKFLARMLGDDMLGLPGVDLCYI